MDAAKITETNVANAQRADGSFASTFDSLHVPNVDFHGIMGQFLANMESVNAKASPFIPQEPVVLPQRSLPLLHNQFMASNVAAPHAESVFWNGVATQITDSVTSLYGVKNLLGSSMETEWVRNGDARINQIQRAGAQYAMHASQMAGHNIALAATTSAESTMAAASYATYMAIPKPELKLAFERAVMAAFSPRATASLTTTVPRFDKLLPDLSTISGDPFSINEITEPNAPTFDRSPLPSIVAEALTANGYGDLARAQTPSEVISQYGQPNPDTLAAIAAGETRTQAASVAAPTMPPSLTPGSALGNLAQNTGSLNGLAGNGATGIFGGGAGGLGPAGGMIAPTGGGGAAGALGSGAGGGAGYSPLSPGATNAATTAQSQRGSAAGGGINGRGEIPVMQPLAGQAGGPRPPLPGAGGAGQGGAIPRGGMGGGIGGGAGFAPTSMPLGGAMGGGFGAGAGAGAGATGGGLGAGGLAHGANGSAHGNQTHANQQSRAMAVGGAPMAGAAGNGNNNDRKSSKVKAVTSAVERDGNLRALLGEAPLVLPTVIGDDVRR
ncbi:hypothetical protein [Corynebacterium glaucum]|uniref:hypothetical protein n=2 Tax=Corynebacterium glaucum TaxID=187491 RepID=UPI0025B40534|nr:hypothetical protein [Corynebacterium glaucum]